MDKDTERYLISKLREASVTWGGRSECLKRSRKKVQEGFLKDGSPKWKYYYQCAKCLEWFRDVKSLEVDHIVEIGPFTGDWTAYISKMFCGQDNLQALCSLCHQKKTSGYNATLKFKRKI